MMRECYLGTKALGAAFLGVGLPAFLALALPPHAYDGQVPNRMVAPGGVLIQDEGAKPDICFGQGDFVRMITGKNPDATIDLHHLDNGTMWMFVDYRDMTGALFPMNDRGLVCRRPEMNRFSYTVLRTLTDLKDRTFDVWPIWPEPLYSRRRTSFKSSPRI